MYEKVYLCCFVVQTYKLKCGHPPTYPFRMLHDQINFNFISLIFQDNENKTQKYMKSSCKVLHNNKNMPPQNVSLQHDNLKSTSTSLRKSSFSHSNERQFSSFGIKMRSSPLPQISNIDSLQLYQKLKFYSQEEIRSHFHVKGASKFSSSNEFHQLQRHME